MIQDKIRSYFEGNPNLHVLFVFDTLGTLVEDINACTWSPEYRIVEFNKDWFTVKYRLTHDWKHDKVILIFVGMTSPQGTDRVSAFPLYGELKANMVYSEENYITFMQLRGISEAYASYISRHINELQLSKYDRILSEYYKPGVFSTDICNRGLLSGYLGANKLLSWEDILIKLVCLCGAPGDREKRDSFFRALRSNIDSSKALADKMKGICGVSYNAMSELRLKEFAESFKYNAITQNIPAISADDYRSYKIDNAVVLQRLNSFRETAVNHPTLSSQFITAIDYLASSIQEDKIVCWYGPEAEYLYVTDTLCIPIIRNFIENKAFLEPVETNEKLRSFSMRLSKNSPLLGVVNFLSNACFMLEKIKALGTYKLKDAMAYINKYRTEFYLVDTYYRLSVDTFKYVDSLSPVYDSLIVFKNHLDTEYSKQCNLFNQEWIKCINESGVKLVELEGIAHQQNFYNDRLKGVNTKRVVIVSDALRYEVAVEILNGFGDAKHTAILDATLAILPTETKYSKMTLLPHSLLQYRDCALYVDGKILETTPQRTNHVKMYEADALCIDYADLDKLSRDQKRELFKSPLVYIFHDVIDSISHDNPSKTTTTCAETIADMKKLIPSLHATYNVANVYLTSDHGFLFNDMNFEEKDKHKVTDDYDERKTRYYITNDPSQVFGISKFAMSDVSTMTSADKYVAVPNGTNRLNAEGGGYQYTHGGASLQEMIIPVLYSHIRRENNKQKVGINLLGSAFSIVSSRLKFSFVQSDAISENFKERTIKCGIYEGSILLTNEKVITLNSADVNPQNRFSSVELVLSTQPAGGLLELRIFDVDDPLNPLAKAIVTNKTLIEQDF